MLPGDLFLAAGTFQHELEHCSLNYTEAGNVDEVLGKWSVCSEAQLLLKSAAYQRYFDNTMPQPDRSVITFRRIEKHKAGCPEVVEGGA